MNKLKFIFLGVPFTTKDSTSVANRLHTLGIVARRNTRTKEDAECVKLMKEAGMNISLIAEKFYSNILIQEQSSLQHRVSLR